jgi:hypothetical protein
LLWLKQNGIAIHITAPVATCVNNPESNQTKPSVQHPWIAGSHARSGSADQLGDGPGTSIDGLIRAIQVDYMVLQIYIDDGASMILDGQFQRIQKSGFVHYFLLMTTIVKAVSNANDNGECAVCSGYVAEKR